MFYDYDENEHHQDKDIDLTDAFEAGFEYANEVNGKELLYVANQTAERTKKEVIYKACEWLSKHISPEDIYDDETNEVPNTYLTVNLYDNILDFINEFRKAMEK